VKIIETECDKLLSLEKQRQIDALIRSNGSAQGENY